MATSWIVFPKSAASHLAKARVRAYTRRDGAFVAEHDDKRPAKQSQAGGYDHPSVVGHATPNHADPAQAHSILFNGRHYSASGGGYGTSLHDGTKVRQFNEVTEDEDNQHRVWMDDAGRVHADSKYEVPKLRAEYEAHQAKGGDQVELKPDIGAGGWRTGHQVRVSDSASPLHNVDGTVTGPGHADGYANVTYPNGKTHSVHSADLLPATGYKWPDVFTRQSKKGA
jgi:hypothetical protein